MTIAAYSFVGLAVFITLFQLALALGAPLGEFTLGGRFPGVLPPKVRLAALAQTVILWLFTAMVLSGAGLAFESLLSIARVGILLVVAFFVLGSVANLSSSSRKERLLMGPLNVAALILTLVVAIG